MKSTGGGVSHAGVGWVIKIWPHQNHFCKGYKIWILNIKIIIIILLLQLYYILNYIKKLLPDVPCIKILLAGVGWFHCSKRKKQKGCLCSQWNWNAFSQSNYQQKHAFSHIIQKAIDNNFSEEKTEYLTCDRSNYSVKFFTAHSTPVSPTPSLHNPPHPYMTHPTPPLHQLASFCIWFS